MSEAASRHLRALDVRPGTEGVLLVHEAVRAALKQTGPPVALLPLDDGSPHVNRQRAALLHNEAVDPDIAVVVTTSGSSGDPVGVLLGTSALTSAASASHEVLPAGPGRWLVAMPVTAVGGLMTVVRSIDADIAPVPWRGVGGAESFTPESFAEAAERTLELCAGDGAPAYVSLVPTQLARLLTAGPSATDLLAGFTHVLIGAAALPDSVRAAATQAGIALTSTYGASETCGGVVYDGIPLPGVTVEIDGANEGPVVIGGETLASGYLGNAELTTAAFPDGRFHTSDIGYLLDGHLTLLGRTDDVIKVGGRKVSLLAMSNALRGLADVDDVAVIALHDAEWGQRPLVLVVGDVTDTAIDVALVAAIGSRQYTVSRVESLPYLPNGKIDRMALRQFTDGD